MAEPDLSRFLRNYRINSRRGSGVAFPPASRIFPGVDPALDARLHPERDEADVALCEQLASVLTAEQPEFLDRYRRDPGEAHRWLTLPAWKRPIMAGDEQDRQIWKFFTMQRLNMEQAADPNAKAWPMDSQGALLARMAGVLRYITDREKLFLVLSLYGSMLADHLEIGDPARKPWEDAR
jgi:hypothetical protein